MSEVYYRYDGYEYAQCDTYPVLRRTAKGVWINIGLSYPGLEKEKFILDGARKRWAYPTKELALESFQIRKERQIRHCNDMIERANKALVAVGLRAIDPASRFRKYDDWESFI